MIGAWGGSCTCPDGQVYAVSDNDDACGSLACVGGVSGQCNQYAGSWSYNKVICASSPTPTLSPTTRPTTSPTRPPNSHTVTTPQPTLNPTSNIYQTGVMIGAW